MTKIDRYHTLIFFSKFARRTLLSWNLKKNLYKDFIAVWIKITTKRIRYLKKVWKTWQLYTNTKKGKPIKKKEEVKKEWSDLPGIVCCLLARWSDVGFVFVGFVVLRKMVNFLFSCNTWRSRWRWKKWTVYRMLICRRRRIHVPSVGMEKSGSVVTTFVVANRRMMFSRLVVNAG